MEGEGGCELFFRSAEQLTNAISIRDDVTDGRDTGKPGVRRYERISTRRAGGCGQNGIEGAGPRSLPEKAQPFAQVGFLDDEQRRQQLDIVAGKFRGVYAVTTASADVSELLDDLGSGGGQDRSVRDGADQLLAWLTQRVVDADPINQDGCVKDGAIDLAEVRGWSAELELLHKDNHAGDPGLDRQPHRPTARRGSAALSVPG
jgi:hypothetical protein